jgi:UDP-3-O-[3-hydroxymyristoyl] glucosamine N-acyltransferase
MTLAELAERLGCRLEGDGAATIVGVADLATARGDEVALFAHPRYRTEAAATQAGAVIVAEDAPPLSRPLLRAKSPFLAFAQALAIFHTPPHPAPGISPHAAVDASAVVDPAATIGPFVSIGAHARVGAGSILESHVAVAADAVIGRDCHLHSQVSIRERVVLGDRVVVQNGAVIGSDGFGFTRDPAGAHVKVPQVGTVVIESDVEIGANTTIDRATVGETRIGAGTKIDNLVQVGHNVRVGRDVLLAAQVGISGSATLEDRVTLGGQVGVQGHIVIGRGAIAAGQSGVTNSVEPGRFVTGYPAIDNRAWRKASVVFSQLPALRERLKAVERRLGLGPNPSVTESPAPADGTTDDDTPGDAGTPVP